VLSAASENEELARPYRDKEETHEEKKRGRNEGAIKKKEKGKTLLADLKKHFGNPVFWPSHLIALHNVRYKVTTAAKLLQTNSTHTTTTTRKKKHEKKHTAPKGKEQTIRMKYS
jgi:hypothetical protein